MQKSSMVLSLVVILILAFAIFAFAQRNAHFPSSPGELGYYDRATGVFTPLQQGPEAELPPVAPTTGTLVFKFTITAKSALPKNSVIGCSAVAAINSDSSGFNTTEKASGVATLVSGTTYTCTSTINYSWPLSSPTTDKISFSNVHAFIDYGYQVTSTNGTGILVEPVVGRDANPSSLPNINVPANGATTTEDVSITL
jgi:hypothetical protein